MPELKQSKLKRRLQPMPPAVLRALRERKLVAVYRQRPPYQRNDYLAWIGDAKGETTRQRRLSRMLDELEQGDRYMAMKWAPLRAAKKAVAARSTRKTKKKSKARR